MSLYTDGQSSAVSQIVAAVESFISELPDGSQQLDAGALAAWLVSEAETVIAGLDVGLQGLARDQLNSIATSARDQIFKLRDYIGRNNWEARSDWPTAYSLSNNKEYISGVAKTISEMTGLVDKIETYYADTADQISSRYDAFYTEHQLDATLPIIEAKYVDSRYYIYTYVTDRGEESAPSPVSEVIEVADKDVVTVTVAVPSGMNATKWRLYRTNTGNTDSAFQFVAEIDLPTLTYEDTLISADLQEVAPSITWDPPPSNLKGMTAMHGGIMAGFFDNTVAFSEPSVPYAWPIEYQITTEHPIVSLATFDQTLVVGTRGAPYFISGADSANMSAVKMPVRQSCVSARSMVPVDGGVVYASPDGLCLANNSGISVVTTSIYSRNDWQALNPYEMVCGYHDGVLYMFGGNITGALTLHLPTGRLGQIDMTATAIYADNITDKLYIANGASIYALYDDTTSREAQWKSKKIVMPKQSGFSWIAVESDFAADVVVELYGDGTLYHTATVSSRTPVRLPAGMFLEHEIKVTSTARWNSLTLASSTAELQGA